MRASSRDNACVRRLERIILIRSRQNAQVIKAPNSCLWCWMSIFKRICAWSANFSWKNIKHVNNWDAQKRRRSKNACMERLPSLWSCRLNTHGNPYMYTGTRLYSYFDTNWKTNTVAWMDILLVFVTVLLLHVREHTKKETCTCDKGATTCTRRRYWKV